METVRQDFVQTCAFLGGKHSESTTCSFILSFLSIVTTSKMRDAGGEGCPGHQRTEQIQSSGTEYLRGKMQQEPLCSVLQGQSQRNELKRVHVGGDSSPFGSSCPNAPGWVSAPPPQRTCKVLKRDMVLKIAYPLPSSTSPSRSKDIQREPTTNVGGRKELRIAKSCCKVGRGQQNCDDTWKNYPMKALHEGVKGTNIHWAKLLNTVLVNDTDFSATILKGQPWVVWLSGLSAGLGSKGSQVWFPVRGHAWIVDRAPSGGHMRGNHTLMFLFLPPSPLSKNK